MSRKHVNIVAAIVAGLVLIGGGITLAAVGVEFTPPLKTTTQVEKGQAGGTGKRLRQVDREHSAGPEGNAPNPSGTTIKRSRSIEQPITEPSMKRVVTKEEGSRSFFERIGGKTGQVFLLIGVLILAAFIAGAFVQRLLLGDFSIKLGGVLELGTVEEAKEDNTVKLTAEVEKLKDELGKGLVRVKKQKKDLEAASRTIADTATSEIALARLVKLLETEVDQLRTLIENPSGRGGTA